MKTLITAFKLFIGLTILTGIIYPLLVTGIAQLIFPQKANGSFIQVDNKTIGSKLIGQAFDSTKYFSSRPSAVSYNPQPSGASNYGLTNEKLKKQVEERRQQFLIANQLASLTPVPAEMLFASASGLDPHISPQAAWLQVDRIAKARKFSNIQKQKLQQMIEKLTEHRQYYLFGEERINVLLLNLSLDKL